MAILARYPQVSQRTTIRPNPDPDPNGDFDCVEASVGSAILWYEGKNQWDETIDPDALKIAAYGEYYTGGTSAARLTAICQKLGYNLYPIDNVSAVAAIQKAHELISSGKPAIFTQQDDYSSNPDYTHVCVFFADGPGNLTCLDPFPLPNGVILQKTDSQWAARLRSTQLWTIEPINTSNGDLKMLQLSDPMGAYFVDKSTANHPCWHCIKTNADLAYAHLSFYRLHGGIFGLNLTGEIYLESLPKTAIVIYERAIAIYDPNNATNTKPYGSGTVYLLRIDEGIGQQIIAKPLIVELNNQIEQLKTELAAKPDVTALQAKIAAYEAAIKQVVSIMQPLEAK